VNEGNEGGKADAFIADQLQLANADAKIAGIKHSAKSERFAFACAPLTCQFHARQPPD
jgi:hypothetical protein